MMLTLLRKFATTDCTIGELCIDGRLRFYTLEDEIREVKIKDETAIPAGIYKITINHSPKFGELTPLLLDVPNFDHIRIHPGNTDDDTSGCILVGMSVSLGDCKLIKSRVAFDNLMSILAGETYISIDIVDVIGVPFQSGDLT